MIDKGGGRGSFAPMSYRLVPALPFLLAPALAAAQSNTVTDPRISLRSGIICTPEIVAVEPSPGTVTGDVYLIEGEVPFVSTGQSVPAALGVGFGIKVSADPGVGLVEFHAHHPPMGPDGVTRQQFRSKDIGPDLAQSYYHFDFDWEMVEGPWTFEGTQDGEVLFSVTFEVVPPSDLPELAAACGYVDLLS